MERGHGVSRHAEHPVGTHVWRIRHTGQLVFKRVKVTGIEASVDCKEK